MSEDTGTCGYCGMEPATHDNVPIGLTEMNLCADCYAQYQCTRAEKAEAEVARLRDLLEQVVNAVMPYSPRESTVNMAGQSVSSEPTPAEMVADVLGRQERQLAAAREALAKAEVGQTAWADRECILTLNGAPVGATVRNAEPDRWWSSLRRELLLAMFPPGTCETCGSLEDGGHYCLLHGRPVRDANIRSCSEWSARSEGDKTPST